MITPDEIQVFLQDFHKKIGVWEMVVKDERGRTSQTLLNLEITKKERDEILLSIEPEDYCEGPLPDTLTGLTASWVFGKRIKGEQVAITIMMAARGAHVICVSFRISQFIYQCQRAV